MLDVSAPNAPGRRAGLGWLYLVVLGCLVIWAAWWARGGDAAQAQTGLNAAAGQGLLAVPAQITRDSYGLFLIDPAEGTICVYQYQATTRKLQLLASRAYRFDVRLDDWNTLPPPREIQDLVGQQKRLEALDSTTQPVQPRSE